MKKILEASINLLQTVATRKVMSRRRSNLTMNEKVVDHSSPTPYHTKNKYPEDCPRGDLFFEDCGL